MIKAKVNIKRMKTSKIILLFLIFLYCETALKAQDGSDILYAKVAELDTSFIGDFVHFDFNNRSLFNNIRDTVVVNIDQQSIRFLEHRVDDGYNNWFDEQYLEAFDKMNGLTIRIVKSKLDSITKDSIFVTSFLEYYGKNNKLIVEKSRQIKCSFLKKGIKDVLVSATSHKSKK